VQIKMPDFFPTQEKREANTAMHVKDITFVKLADALNWLNFYGRRCQPYTMYSPTDLFQDTFPIPVGGADYTQRYLCVLVGVKRHDDSSSSNLRISSTTLGGLDSGNYKEKLLLANPGAVTDTDDTVSYFVEPVEVTGNKIELIEVYRLGGYLDGVGIWELPQNTSLTTIFGGRATNTAAINSTASGSIQPVNFFSGRNIVTSDIEDCINSHDGCWGVHGRIFFRALKTSIVTSSVGTYVKVPVGGIRFPKTQGVTGRSYVNIGCLIKCKVSSGSGYARLYSEGLSYSGSAASFSNSTLLWQPKNSISNTDWDSDYDTYLTGRADPDGDWVYLEIKIEESEESILEIEDLIMWVEESM
jgi:hypothetical protein